MLDSDLAREVEAVDQKNVTMYKVPPEPKRQAQR